MGAGTFSPSVPATEDGVLPFRLIVPLKTSLKVDYDCYDDLIGMLMDLHDSKARILFALGAVLTSCAKGTDRGLDRGGKRWACDLERRGNGEGKDSSSCMQMMSMK